MKIVKTLGLRPNLPKNECERAMGVLPDVPVASPRGPAAPQEHPGRALGALQNVPRASGSAPEASSERPGSAPNRPKSLPRGPRTIFHQFFVDLGSIFDGFCVDFLFAWSFVCLLLRSIARSTFAVHLRFSCALRALRTTSSVYNPHLVRV